MTSFMVNAGCWAFIGFVFGAAFNEEKYGEIRAECEQFLPRNEHCVLVAQPAPKELDKIIEEK